MRMPQDSIATKNVGAPAAGAEKSVIISTVHRTLYPPPLKRREIPPENFSSCDSSRRPYPGRRHSRWDVRILVHALSRKPQATSLTRLRRVIINIQMLLSAALQAGEL